MTRSLGIDIGSYSIKIAEVDYTSKDGAVLGLYEIALGPDENPRDKLLKFFQSGPVRPDRIAVGLGAMPVLVKKLFYPFSDRKKVQAAVHAEFEDSVPFDLDDYLIEFQKLGKIQKSHVYLAGICHKGHLTKLGSYFEDAGNPTPNAFCLDNEALARLALLQNKSQDASPETFVLCDIGFQSTKLAVLKELPSGSKPVKDLAQNILEMRTLGKGALEIYDWMETQRNMSVADCEQWLTHRAKIKNDDSGGEKHVSDETSDDVKTALKPVLVEIYQTLQALKSKQGITASYILLTGGLSQLPGFAEFFAKEIRIETRLWDPLDGYTVSPTLITKNKRSRFAMALALADRFRPGKLPQGFNFRRSSFAERKVLSSVFDRMFAPEHKPLAIGFAATFAFFVFYQLTAGYFVQKERNALKGELVANFRELDPVLGKRAAESIEEVDRLSEMFETEKQRQLKNLDPGRAARSDLMLSISQAIPKDVRAEKVLITDAQGSSSQINIEMEMPTQWDLNQKTAFSEKLTKDLEQKGFREFTKNVSGNKLKLSAKWQEAI